MKMHHHLGNEPRPDVMTESSFNKHHRLQFLQKNLQYAAIMLCLTIAWFFLSYSPAFYNFQQSLEIYFPIFVFPIVVHTLERKWYMFLICNGILAFLAITSSFDTPSRFDSEPSRMEPSAITSNNKEESTIANSVKCPVIEQAQGGGEEDGNQKTEEQKEGDGEEQERVCLETEARGSENVELNIEEEGTEESGSVIEETQPRSSEGVGMNEETFNTDELNKKFEEFIQRKKEELRFEAQWQLVVA